MPDLPEEPLRRLADRVTSLEELLMHFDHTVGQLDEVVRQVQDRLDTLERRVESTAAEVNGLAELKEEGEQEDETSE